MTAPATVDRVAAPTLRSSVPVLALLWTLINAADAYLMLALMWMSAPLGWSTVTLAMVILAIRLPVLLGGFAGEQVIERIGALSGLRLQLAASTVVMTVLAGLSFDGDVSLTAVLLCGGVASALLPLSYATTRVLVTERTPADALGKANAVLGIGDQLPAVLAAGLAGPALQLFDRGAALILPPALLLLATALALLAIRPASRVRRPAANTKERVPRGRMPGRVRALLALSAAYYFCYSPLEPAFPGLVRDQLHGGPGGYGLLWTCFGLGSLSSLVLVPTLTRFRPGVVNAGGAVIWGLLTLPLAHLAQLGTAVPIMIVSGLVWGPYPAVETTALTRWTDPRGHARVFGIQRALLSAISPLGAAVGALLLQACTPQTVITAATTACALAGLVALAARGLRQA